MASPLGLLTAFILLLQTSAFTLPRNPPQYSPLTQLAAAHTSRRALLTTSPLLLPLLLPTASPADDFESIAARAAAVSAQMTADEEASRAEEERRARIAQTLKEDSRCMYDFTLPVGGRDKSVAELVGGRDLVKAVLVVNIKQDDPLARKNIPELIALAERCVVVFTGRCAECILLLSMLRLTLNFSLHSR